MNVLDAQILDIRPAPQGGKMLGVVRFTIAAETDQSIATAHYHCSCSIPNADNPEERIAQIKDALVDDAIRQIRRMPEIRSGAETLNLKLQKAAA